MKSFYQMLQKLNESAGLSLGNDIVQEVKEYVDAEFAKLSSEEKEDSGMWYFCRDLEKKIENFSYDNPITNIVEELFAYHRLIGFVCEYLSENEIDPEFGYRARRGITKFMCYYNASIPEPKDVSKIFDVPQVIFNNDCGLGRFEKALKVASNLRQLAIKHGYHRGSNWESMVVKLTTPRDSTNESIQDDFVITLGLSGHPEFAKIYNKLIKSPKVGVDVPKNYTQNYKNIFSKTRDEGNFSDNASPEYEEILKRYLPNTFFDFDQLHLIGEFESFGPYNFTHEHPSKEDRPYGYDEAWKEHMNVFDNHIFYENNFRDDLLLIELAIFAVDICKNKQLNISFKKIIKKITDSDDDDDGVFDPHDESFFEKCVSSGDLLISDNDKKILKLYFYQLKEVMRKIIIRIYSYFELVPVIMAKRNDFPKKSKQSEIRKLALSLSRKKSDFMENESLMLNLSELCMKKGLLKYGNVMPDIFRAFGVMNKPICNMINQAIEQSGVTF